MNEETNPGKASKEECPEAIKQSLFDSRAYRCGSVYPCPKAIESGKMKYCGLCVNVEVRK